MPINFNDVCTFSLSVKKSLQIETANESLTKYKVKCSENSLKCSNRYGKSKKIVNNLL